MTDAAHTAPHTAAHTAPLLRPGPWLWVEATALYLIAPLIMAFALPADWMWPVLFSISAVGVLLLILTPGTRVRDLWAGGVIGDWRLVAVFALATFVTCYLLVVWLRPWALWGILSTRPELWVMIMALYPIVSVIPQEIVYRALFFRRHGALFGRYALIVNAAAFSLAHLFLWNWVALTLTFVGGAAFAYGYRRYGFLNACLLHGLAGQILFTVGLGVFFYHGAAPR